MSLRCNKVDPTHPREQFAHHIVTILSRAADETMLIRIWGIAPSWAQPLSRKLVAHLALAYGCSGAQIARQYGMTDYSFRRLLRREITPEIQEMLEATAICSFSLVRRSLAQNPIAGRPLLPEEAAGLPQEAVDALLWAFGDLSVRKRRSAGWGYLLLARTAQMATTVREILTRAQALPALRVFESRLRLTSDSLAA